MNRLLRQFDLCLMLVALPVLAVDRTQSIVVMPSAAEQLAASRDLISKVSAAATLAERHAAVAAAVASLEVIPRRWPTDANSIATAFVLEADLLSAPTIKAYPSAEQLTRRALAIVGNRAEAALLHRALGESLAALHRPQEAEAAFRAAEDTPNLRKLSAIEQLSIYQSAGLFFDRQQRPREAAQCFRAAANIHGLSDMTTLALTVQTLEHAADTDPANAKNDLKHLDDLLLVTLQHNHSAPADLILLKEYQAVSTRYHKKLD